MHKTFNLQPSHTLITDLRQTEEQLLSQMHEKTRYNIRLAQKKDLVVDLQATDFESAWSVFEQTASRDEFRLHPKAYYRKMLGFSPLARYPSPARGEGMGGEGARGGSEMRVFLATASKGGLVLAANIMIDFGDTRTYLHGASSNQHRNLMAPYLLHSALMKDAKAKGISFYDWWGVAPVGAAASHPWAGISRFKRGFGGEEISYPGTYDLIFHPMLYYLYAGLRFARRKFGSLRAFKRS